jgi:hypothetical protein
MNKDVHEDARCRATKLETILSVVACPWRHKATDSINTP